MSSVQGKDMVDTSPSRQGELNLLRRYRAEIAVYMAYSQAEVTGGK